MSETQGKSVDELSDSEKREYNSYLLKAKELWGKSEHHEALQHYQQAYKLYPSQRLEGKISKLMKALNITPEGSDSHLQSVSEKKRPCEHTPLHGKEKRRSPSFTEENQEDKENKPSVERVSAGFHLSEKSIDELSDLEKGEYNSYLLKAKELWGKSEHHEALQHYQQAYQLYPSQRLEGKISKLMKALNITVEGGDRHLQSVSKNNRPLSSTPLSNREIAKSTSLTEVKKEDKENKHSAEQVSTDSSPAEEVTSLMARAKQAIKEDNVTVALQCYERAQSLAPSETLERRIQRMKTYLAESSKELEKEEKSAAQATVADTTERTETSSVSSAEMSHPSSDSNDHVESSFHTSDQIGALSDEQVAIYNSLLSQAKVTVRKGDFQEALSFFQQAYELHPSDKLISKINKLKVTCETEPVAERSVDQLDIDAHYGELIARGRQLVEQQDLEGALSVYEDALGVKPSDKLERRIERIREYIKQQNDAGPSADAVSTPDAASTPSRNAVTEPTSADGSSAEEMYNNHIRSAKACVADGNVKEALEQYKKAAKIRPSDKLNARIRKCKDFLESSEDADDSEFALVGNGFYLHQDLYSKLYPHQKEGLLWLWGLHKKCKGGILADDMGLGKTIQVIAFLSGLFDAEEAKTIIIVMPLSLIENWRSEFDKWAPGIQVQTYHGGSARERARCTAKIQRRGGVLLTSYGMIVSAAELLAKKDGESFGREFKYDYVILDEGHKIKNPTKTSKGVHLIAAKHRIILTGTPIQNNLKEMWALFDWTHHGMLLGTARTFQMEYNKPITRAREKCATYGERRLGEQMADSLKRIIAPFLLRRTKAEVKAEARARGTGPGSSDGPEMPNLTRKNDFVVWCYLSELQKNIYESFTQQDEIKQLLNTSKSPLTALVVLKKICDHPRLLSLNQCHKLGLFTPQELQGVDGQALKECAANTIKSVDDSILLEESGKLRFLVQLMARLKEEGHRTLIFSLSRKILDVIQKVLTNRGHKVMRMDGTITDLSEREKCVSSFQKSNTYDTFLLTTQVGGVGLTLTAADRVVIFDPSWNPATDSQAVDRAFRIGQQKNVCIYRFISCGTIEEKIYRRQVFKDSVNRQTMQKDDKNLFRYFSNTELYELFQLDDTRVSRTQQQLEQMHSHQRVTDTALDEHIAFLYSCDMYGLSDHDLMFSKEDEDLEGDENPEYIEERVNKAIELLSKESELQGKMNEEEGKYIPGHLNALPKAKQPQPQEEDLTAGSSNRLFPEYNYATDSNLHPANDWRNHAADDSIMEVSESSVNQSAAIGVGPNMEDRDNNEISVLSNSPEQLADLVASSPTNASEQAQLEDMQAAILDSFAMVNPEASTSLQSPRINADLSQIASPHLIGNNSQSDEGSSFAQALAETSIGTGSERQTFVNSSNIKGDDARAGSSFVVATDVVPDISSMVEDDRQCETSHVKTGDKRKTSDIELCDKLSETSDTEAGVSRSDTSHIAAADGQGETSHLEVGSSWHAETGGNQGEGSVDNNEEIQASEEDALSDIVSVEDEVLVDDSDSTDFEMDNSFGEIEDSQSGSMLGDDFGQLHNDYIVKESDDDMEASQSMHRRRSTVLPLPNMQFSDDEGGEA
ncbi:DNA excision repair protein ERCC-6-like isoform X3 [Watersipora subatra]|uniref:DNA excision repair protein ERCC-6-like isoform X1 n=1 Tax=Watersipora subatra TaxID=2589382 RepID=UPI00355B588B